MGKKIDDATRASMITALMGGMSVMEVCAEFDTSQGVVYKLAAGLNIVDTKKIEKEAAVCKDYIEHTEWSVAKICAVNDVGQNTLYRILARHDIPNRTFRDKDDVADAAKVIEMFDAGCTLASIQGDTHRGFPFIYRTLRDNNRSSSIR